MRAQDMTPVQLDQREYFAHVAQLEAEGRAAQLEAAARRACAVALTTYALAAAGEVAAAASEWRGIAKACYRERTRLARIKHGRTR